MLIAPSEQPPQWLNNLLAFIPWLIIFLLIWAAVYRFLRKKSRDDEMLQQIAARLGSVESKVDRLLQQNGAAREDRPNSAE